MAQRWSGVTSQADQAHWRRKISVTKIIQRLNEFALADPDNANSPRMTRTQCNVALSLLRKVLPDVASIEIQGPGGGPVSVQVLRFSDVVIDQEPKSLAPLVELPLALDVSSSQATEDC
jgi:hypothetical protein